MKARQRGKANEIKESEKQRHKRLEDDRRKKNEEFLNKLENKLPKVDTENQSQEGNYP